MLKIVSTPIGNLGDFSPRAAEALQQVDIIACEDTRTTRKLITLCSLDVRARLVAYHDHNGHEMRPLLLSSMQVGKQVALASDAGTPLISDPGYKLVAACHKQGIAVTAIPGPAAPLMALTISAANRSIYLSGVCATKTDRCAHANCRICQPDHDTNLV